MCRENQETEQDTVILDPVLAYFYCYPSTKTFGGEEASLLCLVGWIFYIIHNGVSLTQCNQMSS